MPLELIRVAGANRLRVVIDYRAERGRLGPAPLSRMHSGAAEPGTCSCTSSTDHGALRSYRLDRSAGVQPTTHTFVPRYRVEF